MANTAYNYGNSTESNLLKVKYGKLQEKQFNEDSQVYGLAKINKKFTGSQYEYPIRFSNGGGVSAGSLASSNRSQYKKLIVTSKKLYGRVSVDGESYEATKDNSGAFVSFARQPVEDLSRSFARNLERMSVRGAVDGNGALITGNAGNSVVTGDGLSTDTPYVISFDNASTYFPAEFASIEVGDILNVNSETTELIVSDMSLSALDETGYMTGTISVVGTSTRLAALAACCGTAFGGSDILYMQKSKDNEIFGLKGVLSATSGNYHNIDIGNRFQALQYSPSASLSTDHINHMIISQKFRTGRSFSHIMMPHHQYSKFLNLLEDQKRYTKVPAKNFKSEKAKVSYNGIVVATPEGDIPVMMNRFLDSNEIFFLNFDKIEFHLRPEGFRWDDKDGRVFQREANSDSFEARYKGYGQLVVNPYFQGRLVVNL